jgi:hypothetical protein
MHATADPAAGAPARRARRVADPWAADAGAAEAAEARMYGASPAVASAADELFALRTRAVRDALRDKPNALAEMTRAGLAANEARRSHLTPVLHELNAANEIVRPATVRMHLSLHGWFLALRRQPLSAECVRALTAAWEAGACLAETRALTLQSDSQFADCLGAYLAAFDVALPSREITFPPAHERHPIPVDDVLDLTDMFTKSLRGACVTRKADSNVFLSQRRRLGRGQANTRDRCLWVFAVSRVGSDAPEQIVSSHTLMTCAAAGWRTAPSFGVDVPRALELCAAMERTLKDALAARGLPRELAELAARCAWPVLAPAHAATARALAVPGAPSPAPSPS